MIIDHFEKYQAKDQTNRYKTIFKDDPVPLITATKPAFREGDDIPEDILRRVDKDDYSYYVWKKGTKVEDKRGFRRTPQENASIECQVVWKGLVEIFNADKMEDFTNSDNIFVKGMRAYAERRLALDHPFTKDAIEGEA
jgi:hypothetical protein